MEPGTMQILTIGSSLLQTASVIVAMVMAMGTIRGRKDDQVVQMANIQKDIEFIKERISGHDGLRDQSRTAEQSAKSAHKRLDDHLRQEHHKDVPSRE